jgi:hypothetical protein
VDSDLGWEKGVRDMGIGVKWRQIKR